MSTLRKKLLSSDKTIFSNGLNGVEREGLRVDCQGNLVQSPHPQELGSSLTNPFITTDFSEAQIEYTSLPNSSQQELLKELEALCHFVRLKLEADEYLWPLSMPARLPRSQNIPLARYGNSPLGQQKHIYRRGLAKRYGNKMQMISGLHYNLSPSESFWQVYFQAISQPVNKDNISQAYLDAMRNFFRYSYVFPYLFGDSPALDASFIKEKQERPRASAKFAK